jgi:hypothetical protein
MRKDNQISCYLMIRNNSNLMTHLQSLKSALELRYVQNCQSWYIYSFTHWFSKPSDNRLSRIYNHHFQIFGI